MGNIKRKKPTTILECGSGISTVVFGYYSKKYSSSSNQIKVVSMEESKKYHDNIIKIFPNDLKEKIQFLLRDRKEKMYGNNLGSYYENVPDLNYDFLYIDGPVDRKVFNNKNYPKTFNSDLINILLKSNLKVNAVLDQRIHSYRVLKKLLNNNNIKYDVIKKITFF